MNGRPVSTRYRRFAPKYVSNGCNGAQAVLDLRWTRNRRSAAVIAHRLLTNVNCQLLIEKHMEDAKMNADEVVERLSDIARADIADVLEPDGTFDIQSAKNRNKSKLIKSLKFDKDSGKVIGLETYSAHEGARDLGKIHKLFIDKTEITQNTQESVKLIERTILKRAKKTGKPEEEIAESLFAEFSDENDEDYDPEILKPEHWGKFAYLLSKPVGTKGLM